MQLGTLLLLNLVPESLDRKAAHTLENFLKQLAITRLLYWKIPAVSALTTHRQESLQK